MHLGGVVLLAEEAGGHEAISMPAWAVGGGAFLILALLLFIVTRINIDR
jgi:hypothetical protein